MSDSLPTRPGTYISSRVDPEIAEPFVLTAMDRWLWFRGPEITPLELAQLTPMLRLIPFTAAELTAIHDAAEQIAAGLRLNAIGRERWGTSQRELTEELIGADVWRSIVEKTGDQ